MSEDAPGGSLPRGGESSGASFARELAQARPMVVAALSAHFGDLDAGEAAYAAACVALTQSGAKPESLAGWLITVGKRKGIDRLRQHGARQRADDGAMELAQMEEDDMANDWRNVIELPEPIEDERLRLIFICCHPALALEARAALALKVICGLAVPAIAELFVTSESTMFARITRAKAKIAGARVSFELPPRREWPERIKAVLLALELAYTSAYSDAARSRPGNEGGEMDDEVERLATILVDLLPDEPEVLALAALVALARSRETARLDAKGAMVPLSQQDTQVWDKSRIERARIWLDLAQKVEITGPYQIMAAIQLTHARRAFNPSVDWASIRKLYDALMILRPSATVALNRALALAEIEGSEAGLREIETLDDKLDKSRPFHVARARLLERLGRGGEAAAALKEALSRDPPTAERLYLENWLADVEA